MQKHDNTGGIIAFREHVGSGDYKGVGFKLGIACSPDGTLLGLPVVTFDDERNTTVTFELEDILPQAFEFAGIDG